MNKRRLGYWFGGGKLPNGDGRAVRAGRTLRIKPPMEICSRGLHYSKHPMDALSYANTNSLWLIEDCGDLKDVINQSDKSCTFARKHIKKIDAESVLRSFARWCALRVIDKWYAPEIVIRYLKTGDESIRSAARSAAWAAARDAARSAARSAAWAAARDAAWDAAWAAAWAAARSAARDAAWVAAGDAAWAAEKKAQRKKLKQMIDKAFGL